MSDFKIIGVTGRSGSGKSMLTHYFKDLGYPAVDGDAVSREVTEPGNPCLRELVDAFGVSILRGDGTLDRRELAELAFATPENNQKLISITHPHIVHRLLQKAGEAKQSGAPLIFVDGAMIVGGPFEKHCDALVVVVAAQRLSVSRIVLRDKISKTAAVKRLSAQPPESLLREKADFIVDNNDGEENLYRQADEILEKIKQI